MLYRITGTDWLADIADDDNGGVDASLSLIGSLAERTNQDGLTNSPTPRRYILSDFDASLLLVHSNCSVKKLVELLCVICENATLGFPECRLCKVRSSPGSRSALFDGSGKCPGVLGNFRVSQKEVLSRASSRNAILLELYRVYIDSVPLYERNLFPGGPAAASVATMGCGWCFPVLSTCRRWPVFHACSSGLVGDAVRAYITFLESFS